MEIALIIIAAILGFGVLLVLIVIIWSIAIYNNLVKLKNLVAEGWSGIDVQLKRRSNLIPNLVETVKGYAAQEKDILTEVTEARAGLGKEDVGGRAGAERALGQSLMKLFAVAEAYPDLKADQNFRDLQNELSALEDVIQKSRRYYNGTVRDNNILIEQFPSSLISSMFNFQQALFFELENEEDRNVPNVKFGQ